ncbi:ribonuclease P protein component [Chlamydiifrater phoenicopteri]|uniref:ribonuclease P protein component n=1 Tax=Chlamydiifrater phoenicopteri TaxID=2681469 RepID=UPI001BCCA172|nr:ribonuclease P protein component [Chlamydiifrater phoenicopteri]
MSSFSLPKKFRILKRKQFLYTQRQGTCFRGRQALFYVTLSKKSSARLGITVSKKFGKAVARNSFKRKVREAFRHSRPSLPSCSIVVMPQSSSVMPSVQSLFDDFLNCIPKIKQMNLDSCSRNSTPDL